ncbi:MAG: NYN domain-containing protein [Pirellulales bacterium]
MRVLIDGYNLLFQSGLGGRARGPGWIQNARDQLLTFIQSQMSPAWLRSTVVVFDKSQGRQLQLDFQTTLGLQVKFAVEHDEADDLIEELIRKHSSPKSLTVVSSDLRVRRQAVTRRAEAVESEQFLRRLETAYYLDQEEGESSKMSASEEHHRELSEEEVNFWLNEFGGGI